MLISNRCWSYIFKFSVDFANAGVSTARFMIPPKVSNSGNNLTNVVAGAMIYNTSNNTLQFYNGSGWRMFHLLLYNDFKSNR